MNDRPLYTTMSLTKQHAEWITATCDRVANLSDAELLLVRAVRFHDWLGSDTARWDARHDDMHRAALAAGLVLRGGGYTFAESGTLVALPAEPFVGMDPKVANTAHGLAESVLWHNPRDNDPYYRPGHVERQATLTAMSAILAVSLDAFSWTWWTCNLRDEDTRSSITRRALDDMIAEGALNTEIEWTLTDLQAAHDLWSRAGMRTAIDPNHLLEGALAVGLSLRVTRDELVLS